jgi:hypothetical protein
MSVVFPLYLRSNRRPGKVQAAPKPIVKPAVPVIVPKPVVVAPEPVHVPEPVVAVKPVHVPEKHNPVKVKPSRFGTANFSSTTNVAIHSKTW